MGKGSTQTQETEINEDMARASKPILNNLSYMAGVNPYDLVSTGPMMAAVNPAQMQAMDAAATAGNAYNMGFTPASQYLPQSTNINGYDAYDVRGMAMDGISPGMQQLLSTLFGGGARQQSVAEPAVDPRIQDEVDRMSSWDRSANRHGINTGRLRERR